MRMLEKREEDQTEALTGTIQPFAEGGIFDFSADGEGIGGRSFMELLGMQQELHPSPFDLPPTALVPGAPSMLSDATALQPETSDTVSFPATPNSSSISSSSAASDPSRAATAAGDEEIHKNQKSKSAGGKKKGQKRPREPRFAFMTKSEVDHLEDGYRWRKYGQKAVKNSPFPRSYYRCTSAECGVKKRVERSSSEPAVVVTTYEGRHTHPNPVGPRGGGQYHAPPPLTASTASLNAASLMTPPPPHSLNSYMEGSYLPLSFSSSLQPPLSSAMSARHCNQMTVADAMIMDHGLLQDLIPSGIIRMKKE